MEGDARRGGREARRQGGRPSAIVGDNTRTYNGSRIKQNTGASTKFTGSQRTSAARLAVMPRSSKIGIITLGHTGGGGPRLFRVTPRGFPTASSSTSALSQFVYSSTPLHSSHSTGERQRRKGRSVHAAPRAPRSQRAPANVWAACSRRDEDRAGSLLVSIEAH